MIKTVRSILCHAGAPGCTEKLMIGVEIIQNQNHGLIWPYQGRALKTSWQLCPLCQSVGNMARARSTAGKNSKSPTMASNRAMIIALFFIVLLLLSNDCLKMRAPCAHYWIRC